MAAAAGRRPGRTPPFVLHVLLGLLVAAFALLAGGPPGPASWIAAAAGGALAFTAFGAFAMTTRRPRGWLAATALVLGLLTVVAAYTPVAQARGEPGHTVLLGLVLILVGVVEAWRTAQQATGATRGSRTTF